MHVREKAQFSISFLLLAEWYDYRGKTSILRLGEARRQIWPGHKLLNIFVILRGYGNATKTLGFSLTGWSVLCDFLHKRICYTVLEILWRHYAVLQVFINMWTVSEVWNRPTESSSVRRIAFSSLIISAADPNSLRHLQPQQVKLRVVHCVEHLDGFNCCVMSQGHKTGSFVHHTTVGTPIQSAAGQWHLRNKSSTVTPFESRV
jgi:hypothetical protein